MNFLIDNRDKAAFWARADADLPAGEIDERRSGNIMHAIVAIAVKLMDTMRPKAQDRH